MKALRLLTFAVLACHISYLAGCVSPRTGEARAAAQSARLVARLPEEARKQLAEVRVGMTRGELNRKFGRDGGLFGGSRYIVCPYRQRRDFTEWVMFSVGFRPAKMPRATWWDVKSQLAWRKAHGDSGERSDDVVEMVEPPVLSPPHC